MNSLSFCICIPMYNEATNVELCVDITLDFINQLSIRSAMIVVNDGSTDETAAILEKMKLKYPELIMVSHEANRGYGAANVTGMRKADEEKSDYVLFMDGDQTQNVEYLHRFIGEMQRGVDFIKATRYAKGGGTRGVPFKRWLISRVGNQLARFLLRLPLTDYTNGFRAYKTRLFRNESFNETDFSYLLEEVCKTVKLKCSYAEVPYILEVRTGGGASKSKFVYDFRVYAKYLRYLVRST